MRIDHINILVEDLLITTQFYNRVFGFIDGSCFEGGRKKYLYTEDHQQAIIHLVTEEDKLAINQRKTEGHRVHAVPANEHTGALDHVAFSTDERGFNKILKSLNLEGISYTMAVSNKQMWFFDPNGLKVEVAY